MTDKASLVEMLRQMLRIRFFEERLERFYDNASYCKIGTPQEEAATSDELLTCAGYDFLGKGVIGGAVHSSIGQEAVAVGICSHLRADDSIVSSHRGHHHALAKGCDPARTLAELMGREGGLCRGYGGSMHLFDIDCGMLGGNGIIGAQVPISLGPAFAAKYRGNDAVSVAFFGDGGANQGGLYESLNLAALWKLPVLFVCENNLYAFTTPAEIAMPLPDIAPRAEGFGIPTAIVDGQDVTAVYDVGKEAVDRARSGDGPTFIEAKTYRFLGHCGIPAGHQNPEECAEWRKRDPIALFSARLTGDGTLSAAEIETLREEAMAEIDAAEEFAKNSPLPEAQSLAEFIF